MQSTGSGSSPWAGPRTESGISFETNAMTVSGVKSHVFDENNLDENWNAVGDSRIKDPVSLGERVASVQLSESHRFYFISICNFIFITILTSYRNSFYFYNLIFPLVSFDYIQFFFVQYFFFRSIVSLNSSLLTFHSSATLLYSLLYSTLLYSTLLYSTLLYSTLLYSTLLYSILYSLLYSTLLYSILYSLLTFPFFSSLLFSFCSLSSPFRSSLFFYSLNLSSPLSSPHLTSPLFFSLPRHIRTYCTFLRKRSDSHHACVGTQITGA